MDLREKLKKISEKRKSNVDWNDRREAWISAVDKLYDEVESWFYEYFDEGYMDSKLYKIKLSEEFLGDYEINSFEIILGERSSSDSVEEVLVFEPIGRNVIGANGRIDLYLRGRKSDKALLLLMYDSADNYHWEITKNKKDRVVFDRGNFELLIDEWLKI